MAKALKTVAIVAGVTALAFTGVGLAVGMGAAATSFGIGVSASTLFLASAGASIAASLLQKKPQVPASQTDRLTANVDPRAFRKTVLGRTAMPIDVRYEEWSGRDQETCDWIVCHASHACDGIEEIWFNTEMAWSLTTGVVGRYVGYFSVPHIVLEGSAANAFAIASGKWNQSARLTGCCFSHWRFKVTGNDKKAESPFASGLPNRITVIGRGAKLYDPRRDSSVPGGNGSMRWHDQSTWRYTADDGVVIGENLPLQILRVVLGWRIRNPVTGEMKLATGSGVPGRRLALASIAAAANLADERVNRAAGGTEPRYHGAAVVSEGDDTRTVLDMLCAACCGRFRDAGGKLSLVLAHNDLALTAADDGLSDDDVVGAFTWNPDAAVEAVPNVVRGRYVDASTHSLYQMVDYPEVRVPSLDGQDRLFPLDLGAVESASHAQRVAKQVLQRKQYPREFTAPFDIRAWKYAVGDPLPFTFAPLGFVRTRFRVKEQELGQNGICQMTLTFESEAFYQWDASDAPPVQAAEPIVYDASKNPLVLAIDDAGHTADWSAVTDDNGKRPEDNATVGAILGRNVRTEIGKVISPAEVLNSALTLLSDGTLVASVDGVDRPLGKLKLPDMNAASDAARRQLEADLASLAAAVAQIGVGQQIVQNVFRDAGLYTDPANGVAKLFAIESRAEQISKLSVTLNAALASIDLKASVNYVDQSILKAQLGGGNADLNSLLVRLTSAETNISGLQASIQLKADATIVTGLQGSVTSIQQSLDALDAVIKSKASKDIVERLGQRLTLAEQTISAFDGASITSSVTAARRAPTDADVAGGNAILALLGGHDATMGALTAIATAKSELRAITDSNTSAVASLANQLGVQIGAVTALVSTEQQARITGDTATASDLASYKAQTNNSLGSINQSLSTQAGQLSAFSGSLTSLSTTVDGHSNTLTVYGQSIDGLRAKWGVEFNANGVITGFALNNGSGRTDATFVVDNFKIAKSNGDSATVVFAVADDGAIEMRGVRATNIAVGLGGTGERLLMTGKLLSGVKANGRPTFRLGSW